MKKKNKEQPKEVLKPKQYDTIILKFKVESNIKDVKDTYEKATKVNDFLKTFKEFELDICSVEYIWNESQQVQQTKEFLEKEKLEKAKKLEQPKVSSPDSITISTEEVKK
jgi:hypothetical protein